MKSQSGTSSRILCHCFRKTTEEIRSEILRMKIRNLEEVVQRLSAGNGCTLCRPDIEALLQQLSGPTRPVS